MTPLQELITKSFDAALKVIPVLIPIILVRLTISSWINYARDKYINSIEWTLLEIVPPQDITKTPAAMELFFNFLYDTGGEANWINRYIEGKVRNWYSLEIVSVEGVVKFFIRCNKRARNTVETQLYAQYPGIEVKEAEDYTQGITYDPDKVEMMAAEWELTAPDPYPIRTYVDYGLATETEEEFKIDPITPMLEFMGSLTPGHQAWVQYIVRAHKKEDRDPTPWFGPKGKWAKPGSWNKKVDNWVETAKTEIQTIREEAIVEKGEGDKKTSINVMTKGKELRIAALERSVSKLAFDCGIRTVYIANKDDFNPSNIGGLFGTFKQFGSTDLNGFKPCFGTSFDYPWQDISGKKLKRLKTQILEDYKDRAYFWRELRGRARKKMVLNVEELATIFHLPGRVAQTPSLQRVDSKKSAPPANLPI